MASTSKLDAAEPWPRALGSASPSPRPGISSPILRGRNGRGNQRCGPENHSLPAQSPSPSLDRGFGPFFGSYFHACGVRDGARRLHRKYPGRALTPRAGKRVTLLHTPRTAPPEPGTSPPQPEVGEGTGGVTTSLGVHFENHLRQTAASADCVHQRAVVSPGLQPGARSAQQLLWRSQFPLEPRCGRDARGPRWQVAPLLWKQGSVLGGGPIRTRPRS